MLNALFRYERNLIPIPVPDNSDRVLMPVLVGDVYQLLLVGRDGTRRPVQAFAAGVDGAQPDPSGDHIWWQTPSEDDLFAWVSSPIAQTDAFDIPIGQHLGRSRGARATESGVIAAAADDKRTHVQRFVVRHGTAAVESLADLPGEWWLETSDRRGWLLGLTNEAGQGALVDVNARAWKVLPIVPVISSLSVTADGTRVGVLTATEPAQVLYWSERAGSARFVCQLPPGEGTIIMIGRDRSVVRLDTRGRSDLFVPSEVCRIPVRAATRRGSITEIGLMSEREVGYLWTDSTHPPVFRRHPGLANAADLLADSSPQVGRAVLHERTICGIPTWTARAVEPARGSAFLVHGGPHSADFDEYSPERSAWVEAGFTVVHVNYRGSATFGKQWREANKASPGMLECTDIETVYDELVRMGEIADGGRRIIAGSSWGGTLALLAAARRPAAWDAVIAHAPTCDQALNYDLQDADGRLAMRDLFGGTPQTRSDAYRRASPITYVDRMRTPILVSYASDDVRCVPAQVKAFYAEARSRQVPIELAVIAGDHQLRNVSRRIALLRRQLDFARRMTSRSDS